MSPGTTVAGCASSADLAILVLGPLGFFRGFHCITVGQAQPSNPILTDEPVNPAELRLAWSYSNALKPLSLGYSGFIGATAALANSASRKLRLLLSKLKTSGQRQGPDPTWTVKDNKSFRDLGLIRFVLLWRLGGVAFCSRFYSDVRCYPAGCRTM